jgi:hypothetical protein
VINDVGVSAGTTNHLINDSWFGGAERSPFTPGCSQTNIKNRHGSDILLPREGKPHVLRVIAIGLLSVTVSFAAAQQVAEKATLRGVVRHARTGEPIAGARVELATPAGIPRGLRGRPEAPVTPAATTTTAASGEFILTGVDAGAYQLTVMNNGFVRHESAPMELTDGQAVTDLVVRLIPTGTVTGRISDPSGRPIVGVTITLLRRIFNLDGTPTVTADTTVRTNDLGEYRMFWVTPGRYYVSAESRTDPNQLFEYERVTFFGGVQSGNNTLERDYTATFFPGVTDIEKARLIDLQEGGELRGIDLIVTRQKLFSIRGRIVDPITGRPPAEVTMMLGHRPLTGEGTGSFLNSKQGPRWYDSATGTFEISNLAPGRYGLSYGGMSFLGIPDSDPTASSEVTVGDFSVDDVMLTLAVPPVISGNLHVEGELPAGFRLNTIHISLATPNSALGEGARTAVEPDRTFKMNAPPQGTARVNLFGLPAGFYVKEARFDGVDVLKAASKFSVAGNLAITISANGGRVEGRVVDEKLQPVTGIEAVLIPNEMRDRADLFKRATTNSQGRFAINGISPGDYKVFAWERLDGNLYYDPEVMKRYELRGTPVHVEESSRGTVEVKIIPEGFMP